MAICFGFYETLARGSEIRSRCPLKRMFSLIAMKVTPALAMASMDNPSLRAC